MINRQRLPRQGEGAQALFSEPALHPTSRGASETNLVVPCEFGRRIARAIRSDVIEHVEEQTACPQSVSWSVHSN